MNKTLIVLILIVVIAAVLYLVPDDPYTEKAGLPSPIAALHGVDVSGVREISIRQKGDEIVVAKSGESWIVPAAWNYAAKVDVVNGFLSEVPKVTDPEQRATSKTNHATFEVDDVTGRKVQLVGDGSGLPLTFILGKGDQMRRCFFRAADSDTVYSIRSEILSKGYLYAEELVLRDWIEREIYKPPLDVDLVEVSLTTPDGSLRMKRTAKASEDDENAKDTWEVVEPEQFVAEATSISSFVTAVSRGQEAFDPVDPSGSDYGLDPPDRRAEFKFANGDTVALLFGTEVMEADPESGESRGKGEYYVQLEGDTRVFTMRSWKRNRFFKSADEFRPLPEEPGPSETESTQAPGDATEPTTRPTEG